MNNIKNLLADYRYYLSHELGLSKNTIASYQKDIEIYYDFIVRYKKIDDIKSIKREHILSFLKSQAKHCSERTTARRISAIKSFHKFLFTDEILIEDETKNFKTPKITKTIPDILTIEEITKMINSLDETNDIGLRNKAMLELIYGSGLRISECLNLDVGDIHIKQRYIKIHGKGAKERLVPITDTALKLIIKYLQSARLRLIKNNQSNFLFPSNAGKVISRQGFHKIIKELAVKNEINKSISAHTLRHSFATHLLQEGCDIRSLQTLLGHEDIATTQNYTQINNKFLKNLYESSHPRNDED